MRTMLRKLNVNVQLGNKLSVDGMQQATGVTPCFHVNAAPEEDKRQRGKNPYLMQSRASHIATNSSCLKS